MNTFYGAGKCVMMPSATPTALGLDSTMGSIEIPAIHYSHHATMHSSEHSTSLPNTVPVQQRFDTYHRGTPTRAEKVRRIHSIVYRRAYSPSSAEFSFLCILSKPLITLMINRRREFSHTARDFQWAPPRVAEFSCISSTRNHCIKRPPAPAQFGQKN